MRLALIAASFLMALVCGLGFFALADSGLPVVFRLLFAVCGLSFLVAATLMTRGSRKRGDPS